MLPFTVLCPSTSKATRRRMLPTLFCLPRRADCVRTSQVRLHLELGLLIFAGEKLISDCALLNVSRLGSRKTASPRHHLGLRRYQPSAIRILPKCQIILSLVATCSCPMSPRGLGSYTVPTWLPAIEFKGKETYLVVVLGLRRSIHPFLLLSFLEKHSLYSASNFDFIFAYNNMSRIANDKLHHA